MFRVSGGSLETTESGIAIPLWDACDNLAATGTTDVFKFYQGGLSGVRVCTVTITYTDSSKSTIQTVVSTKP